MFGRDSKIQMLRNFVTSKSRSLTNHPVFITVDPIDGDTAACICPLYLTDSRHSPDAFEITIDSNYYRESDTTKLKQIICHELAHIRFPRTNETDHPPHFRNHAKHIGAGIYTRNGMG
jgi:hypothetical protein